MSHERRVVEVVVVRRARGVGPLERSAAPRVAGGLGRLLAQRQQAVDEHHQQPDAEHVAADRRHLVQRLQPRHVRVVVVAARHPLAPHHELDEERQVEADEHQQRRDLAERLVVELARHLRPPVVDAAEERDHGAPHHHVVEVGDDEVRVVQMDVDRERAHHDARHAADGEQEQEAQRVEHRRLEPDRTLVHRPDPVEDLDARRDADQERDQREHDRAHRALARGEHVVAPDEEAEQRDRDRRERHGAVAVDALAAEGAHQLRDHAEGRQDHDVDRRVAVEPEEVLEQHRVTAEGRVEDADAEQTLHHQQHHRDADHRRGEHLHDGGRVDGPQEERHPVPGHARRPHLVDRDDEVEARQDRREAHHERPQRHRDDRRPSVLGVGRVERPARVHAARRDRVERDQRARRVDVEAQQVQPRERHVLRADHDGQQEVAHRRRDRRDDEQEHHDEPVHGEHPVVGVLPHDGLANEEQLRPDAERQQAGDTEEERDGHEIHDPDPLVVHGQRPGLDPGPGAGQATDVVGRARLAEVIVDGFVTDRVRPRLRREGRRRRRGRRERRHGGSVLKERRGLRGFADYWASGVAVESGAAAPSPDGTVVSASVAAPLSSRI